MQTISKCNGNKFYLIENHQFLVCLHRTAYRTRNNYIYVIIHAGGIVNISELGLHFQQDHGMEVEAMEYVKRHLTRYIILRDKKMISDKKQEKKLKVTEQ